MNDILEKYSIDIITNIDKQNMIDIIRFLQKENCDFIEDLIEDYLDIFTIPYQEFLSKYQRLNEKYNNNYLKLASEDMNLLEEIFVD